MAHPAEGVSRQLGDLVVRQVHEEPVGEHHVKAGCGQLQLSRVVRQPLHVAPARKEYLSTHDKLPRVSRLLPALQCLASNGQCPGSTIDRMQQRSVPSKDVHSNCHSQKGVMSGVSRHRLKAGSVQACHVTALSAFLPSSPAEVTLVLCLR